MKAALSIVCITLILCCTPLLYVHAEEHEFVGTCEGVMQAMNNPDVFSSETVLGDFAADALRSISGADVALITADEFSANLQPGEIYAEDIALCFPSEEVYSVVTITPASLCYLLECSYSHLVIDDSECIDRESSAFDGFLQISGLSVRYDATAQTGDKIMSIAFSDSGEALDPEDESSSLTVALLESLLQGNYGYSCEYSIDKALNTTLRDIVTEYIKAEGTVFPPETGRNKAVGVLDNNLSSQYNLPLLAICFALFIIGIRLIFKKHIRSQI